MNSLQHIPTKDYGDVLITLNPLFPPKNPLGTWEYSHPKFTAKVSSPFTLLMRVCRRTGKVAVN